MPKEVSAKRARRIESLIPRLRTEYADLGEVVNLTAAERDALLLLIAANRVQAIEIEMANVADGVAGQRALDQLEKQRHSQFVRLLGEERSALVAAFQETLPIRMETRLVAQLLQHTPWPLSQEKSRRLTEAAIEAFKREPDPGARRDGTENSDAVTRKVLARLGQEYATLLGVARAVLSAEQYACYTKFLEQRDLYPAD
jgi:hypothetical protein